MGLTGLMIWFKLGFFAFLPRWVIDIALAIHFYEAVLATLAIIVWHEMAHLAGASEPQARREEEALWQRFVVDGRVDSRRGLAYLTLLRNRP